MSESRCVHGKNSCKHDRYKYQCKDCGTGRCAHGRNKYACKDCGTGLCMHGVYRSGCKKCVGVCAHGRRKNVCRDCRGQLRERVGYYLYLCPHERDHSRCRDCGTGRYAHGRSFHHLSRKPCLICNPDLNIVTAVRGDASHAGVESS